MLFVTSKDNSNIKKAVKLKSSAKERRKSGLFLAEGLRICMDAVRSGAQIQTLFVTEKAMQKHSEDFSLLEENAQSTICVSENIFALMSDTQSPQGFLSVIKTLDKTNEFDTIKCDGKYLALDNVQDPSNLGTVLRSAEAFNVSGVILSADCCDIYNPKVVRGSMGAVFRIPFIIESTVKDFLEKNPQLNSYAAVVNSKADSLTDVKFKIPCVVVVGNEGNGIKAETEQACQNKITIHMEGKAESLNASVAAAILMWEMMK